MAVGDNQHVVLEKWFRDARLMNAATPKLQEQIMVK
jgi:hypothetical protein